jgi:predicted nucleic acid-binding protein
MNDVLIDTNILIDHLRGNKFAVDLLEYIFKNNDKKYISTITRIELLAGIRTGEEKIIREFLDMFEEVEVNKDISEIAGYYMREYAKSNGLCTADAIIAASVKYTDATLYTLNTKHFPMNDIETKKPY